jgi:hypothetical protein
MTIQDVGGVLLGLTLLALPFSAMAGPLNKHSAPGNTEMVEAVHQAQHEVDSAWEAFHGAAVGGTLASPETQVEIERALHDARRLLVQARQAADRSDATHLAPLLESIHSLSALAVNGSRERKP